MANKKIELHSKTGIPELDAIIKATSQTLGMDVSHRNYGNITFHTTGSLSWDIGLIKGGIPTGRVIEVFGMESTLKTTFCLLCLAARQRWRKANNIEKRDLIVDLEHSITEEMLLLNGVDLDQIIWQRFVAVEPALQCIIDLPKSGYIDYVIFDSVDAGQNERQLSRSVGETDVGGISKDMNFALRQISKIAEENKTTYFFINQIKMNPGAGMYANPKTTPGGKALAFYATLRIEMMTRQPVKEIPNATLMRGKVKKTKFCSDIEEEIQAVVINGIGYDETFEINQIATSLGILRHSGGVTKVWWTSDSEGEPLALDLEKGKAPALELIRNNDELRAKLRETCIARYKELKGKQVVSTESTDED